MRSLPKEKLDPRIKSVWRITDCLWILFVSIFCTLPFVIVAAVEPDEAWIWMVIAIEVILCVILLALFLFVVPTIRYARWRYELSDEFVEIARGIIWRKHFVIPFIRVQNTDTQQGPIMRAFGLSSVTISTAAGSHVIPGLDTESADKLRDKAAELARIAREDV